MIVVGNKAYHPDEIRQIEIIQTKPNPTPTDFEVRVHWASKGPELFSGDQALPWIDAFDRMASRRPLGVPTRHEATSTYDTLTIVRAIEDISSCLDERLEDINKTLKETAGIIDQDDDQDGEDDDEVGPPASVDLMADALTKGRVRVMSDLDDHEGFHVVSYSTVQGEDGKPQYNLLISPQANNPLAEALMDGRVEVVVMPSNGPGELICIPMDSFWVDTDKPGKPIYHIGVRVDPDATPVANIVQVDPVHDEKPAADFELTEAEKRGLAQPDQPFDPNATIYPNVEPGKVGELWSWMQSKLSATTTVADPNAIRYTVGERERHCKTFALIGGKLVIDDSTVGVVEAFNFSGPKPWAVVVGIGTYQFERLPNKD